MMLSVLLLSSLFVQISRAQDIVFPDGEPKTNNHTTNLQLSTKCPINMTFAVYDGETVCECVAGYLYYAPLDSCFKPYYQGPCSSGHFLALRPNASIAGCVENPCGDGSVTYKDACHELLKPGPPCLDREALIINEENFEISCEVVRPVVYQIILAPSKRCMAGSRRTARGQCRPVL